MGQRLNIEIVDHERTYANAYYHWSAYSGSAIQLTNHILTFYKKNVRRYCLHPILLAVKMLESTGAGVDFMEECRILNDEELSKFMPQAGLDRNTGLIAITETGIGDTERAEEGRVTIDIENETVIFRVCENFSVEEYDEYVKEYDYPTKEILPVIDDHHWCDGEPIPFERFDEFIDIYKKSIEGNEYYSFARKDGTVVGWIA